MRSQIGSATGHGWDMHRPGVGQAISDLLAADRAPARSASRLQRPGTTAETPGDLLQWLRSGTGEWLGLVTYQMPPFAERKQKLWPERQLVPAHALRPRSYGAAYSNKPQSHQMAGFTLDQ
jgi:hypothetical protein